MNKTPLLLTAALAAVAAVALTASSPDAHKAPPPANVGTLYVPEGLEIVAWDAQVEGYRELVVQATDTLSGERYLLHYRDWVGREVHPRDIMRIETAPMEELTR